MTSRSSIVLALLVGVGGALIERAMPRDTSNAQAIVSASSAPLAAAHAGCSSKAERSKLTLTKAQLACMAVDMRVAYAEPSGGPEIAALGLPEVDPRCQERTSIDEELRRNLELLVSYSEGVIVQHSDGRTGVYQLDERPDDGEGITIARKLPSGDIVWYVGVDVGSRSDPAAFPSSFPVTIPKSTVRREPDGTITMNGKPAPAAMQFMFGEKVEPTKP